MPRRLPLWAFALVYTAVSIGTEVALIVGGLEVPRDNAVIAPIILTLPPLGAAWLAGRRRRELVLLAALTALLTIVVTLTVNRLTGVVTGLLEPLINRPIAALLAALVVERFLVGPADSAA